MPACKSVHKNPKWADNSRGVARIKKKKTTKKLNKYFANFLFSFAKFIQDGNGKMAPE